MASKLLFTGRILARNYVTDMSFVPGYHRPKNIEKTRRMWELLTYFVALPSVALGMINSYMLTKEEEETLERPPYIPYDHMYIMNKPFPWGDGKHSLFHNPERNAVPGIGYEAPWPHGPNAHKK
ncbi:cytochrome c oxidase subunit 6A1, mitochondrial-like [Cotesia glomerata]|uniref:Cytochrome c oxidase subunit n=1 Tax=Cotesia glomerata TaxID=32391 RepID=A0AAV7IY97_COTGL|nr:cytochrome c oxidase subunit 6A1, mitochondrial-like [Cotesia glomerata]KAH0560333.1 hypothetical protein KQX54_003590 [Cotesia glomerata]